MPFIGKQPEVGAYSKLDAITASATATYNLTLGGGAYYPSSANHLLVSLNGVMQAPQDSFTVSGSTIVFDSALTSSDSIDFIMALGDVLDIGTPSDGTVTSSKLAGALTTPADLVVPDGSQLGVGNSNPARLLHLQLPSGVNGEMIRMSRAAGSYHMHLGVSADSDMIFTNNGSTEILRIMNQGGISFDTGSNILDDYEEGTWTPTLLGASSNPTVGYVLQTGHYTKTGNTVNLYCRLQTNSRSGGSGTALIGGLPFAHNSARAGGGVGYISGVNFSSGYSQFGLSGDAVSSTIRYVQSGDNVGSNIINVTEVAASSNHDLVFTYTYQTNS